MRNFWKNLPKPFFVLAPMAEVTDVAFREFIARHGAPPDVYYTAFVSCRGLLSDKGRENLARDLYYTENQRPIVAQVFGSDPKDFFEVAQFIGKLGFDGIDINMGCPDKKIEKSGAGAALLRDPERAQAILEAARRGAPNVPVSVKTRIGYNAIETERWIGALLEVKPDAVVVHGRTRKEMSKVPAHWDEIAVAAKMCREAGVLCVGNGDVGSREEGRRKAEEFGVDGVMIGRGIFGSPFVFSETKGARTITTGDAHELTQTEKLNALGNLIVLHGATWKETKSFHILKKHFSSYIRGCEGSKELRGRMMDTKSVDESLDMLQCHCQENGLAWSVDRKQKITISKKFATMNSLICR